MYLRRVDGHPNLRKDHMGVIHVVDKEGQDKAKLKKEVTVLKNELNEIKGLLKELLEKQK